MDENIKRNLILGLGGPFMIIMGIVSILNISPYKDCGWMEFFCVKN